MYIDLQIKATIVGQSEATYISEAAILYGIF